MKKLALNFFALAALLGATATVSRAADNPAYHLTTVSWIISTKDNMDVDDRYVTLIGRVTGVAKNGDYIFTDGTGTILLDGDDAALPIGPKVVVGGRIDQAYFGLGHLEVDVKKWHPAKTP
jgi:uncharacterized protein YdeI (BOF family)